jgi:hypothetical protein
MILMRENPLQGPLEGWALKIETFLCLLYFVPLPPPPPPQWYEVYL